jgi:HEAT repeat protein
VSRFVTLIAVLGAVALGAAWYARRPEVADAAAGKGPPAAVAGVDTSWMADLYSQNPRDIERGTGKVTALGVKVLPQIQATLRDPSSQHNHRRAALRACGILGVAAEPVLPEVSAALPVEDLTADAAAALSFMGPGALKPLQDGAGSDDAAVRRESLRSLGKLRFRAPVDSASVLPALLDAMADVDETVRGVAATYLGIIHEDAAASVPLLTQGLDDPDPAVRRASATALGSFGGDAASAVPALRRAAAGQDEDLAREAGRALVAVSGK